MFEIFTTWCHNNWFVFSVIGIVPWGFYVKNIPIKFSLLMFQFAGVIMLFLSCFVWK